MKFHQIAGIFAVLGTALLCRLSAAQGAESPVLGVGTIVGDHVNVRGKATLASEVVTRVQKGEKVTILEELTPQKLKADEPPRWFRIALPLNTPVWVHSGFLDETGKTTLQRLNLRADAGENFSILGRIEKGTSVKEFRRKEEWVEIEAPAGAYAFVAADLVEFVGGMVAKPLVAGNAPAIPPGVVTPVEKPAEPEIEVVAVQELPPVVQLPASAPVAAATIPPSAVAEDSSKTPPSTAAVTAPRGVGLQPITGASPIEGRLTRRIVTREGLVSGTFFNSIQAPTFFGLRTARDGRLINYLHAGKRDIKLESYKGRKVLVTGEEFMDRRWVSTPVLEVESVDLAP